MNQIKSISIDDIYNISLSACVYDRAIGVNRFQNSILNLIYTKKNDSNYYSVLDYITNVIKSDIKEYYQLTLINHILTDELPMITYCSSKPAETSDLFQTLIKLENDNNIDVDTSIEILENNLLSIELNNNFKRDTICYILDVKNNKIPISRTLFKKLIKFFYNKKLNNINEFGYDETY